MNQDSSLRFSSGFLKQLAQLLKSEDLKEIQYKEGASEVRIVRNTGPSRIYVGGHQGAHTHQAVAFAPSKDHATTHSTLQEQPPATEGISNKNIETVTTPMVGTAYLAPAPGKPVFVREGQSVKKDDTLLIVEAMKVMNPLKAPVAGVVRKIYVSDGTPVEFGQKLLDIDQG